MPVYGARADEELFGYLGVGHPLGHQPQHLDLSGTEARGERLWGFLGRLIQTLDKIGAFIMSRTS
jgi:hypothetical protein